MSQIPDNPQYDLRSFPALLAALDSGALVDELTNQIREIVGDLHNAQQASGGKPKAKLTVTLDFCLDGGLIEIKGAHATKLPKIDRGKSVFWGTADNFLSRKNPKQQELPLRAVDAPAMRGA